MWDDGSGPPLRGRTDRDDQDGYHGGYGGGGRQGGSEDAYGSTAGYGGIGYGRDQAGAPRGTDEVIEYDLPTTFLPVQGAPMTRPRKQRRKRRPVLTVALVTVATVSIGGGAGLLMARALDRGGVTPGAAVAASPSTPDASTSTPASRSVTPSAPAVRPSSATTKVSRSDPSRSARPSSSAPPAAPRKSSSSTPKSSPSSSKAPTGDAALEASVLTLVNTERAKAGCKPVKSNSKLVLAARRHSQFMADTGKHAHDGIGDGTPQDRIEKAGYAWRGWGENIAWGYTSAASVMDGWMHSAGHKANILNCSYTEIGIGVDRGGINWTQDFGIPG